MKKILVTGGAGFIGYNICRILAGDEDNEVHIVDDLSNGKMDRYFNDLIGKKNVRFYRADLTDLSTYGTIDRDYDQVYHLAAIVGVKRVMENPDITLRVNALSTIYLLDYIKSLEHKPTIVFTSSCENYAGSITNCSAPVPTPENIPLCIEDVHNPRWSYAISKILGEMACLQYAKKYGFNAVVVRYHNVYGPRMGHSHVIPELILRLKKNAKVLELYGGYQYRTFCYCMDAAKMTINLMNNDKAYDKVVNVGNDADFFKISDVAKKICDMMEVEPELVEKGAPAGSVEKRIPDLSLIKALGGYVYDTPFNSGLKNMYAWYSAND
jgi:UDP-glucose 4-epimerase/UDP-glucuronate decarboxylase